MRSLRTACCKTLRVSNEWMMNQCDLETKFFDLTNYEGLNENDQF